jgi:NDP-4-keto-2,6-dideoxyhexose 3-C-methyltransferase
MYSEIKECILCKGTELISVLDLGKQYVVDFVKEETPNALQAPLELVICKGCSLIQLKHRVSQDRLYKKFWYRSGINEQMKDELLAIVQRAQRVVEINKGDRVLDIGCNDGTLLGCYDSGVVTVGIDPCNELVMEGMQGKKKKIDIGISDYFSEAAINNISRVLGMSSPMKFKVITSVAMFYDVPTPVQFLKDCKTLLDKEGVLIIQMNYLVNMLKDNAFDFICHEHAALYSVHTLQKAIEEAGLEFAGLELSKSNGGSIRAFITHKGFDRFGINEHEYKLWLSTNLSMKLMDEMKMELDTLKPYVVFKNNISHVMFRLKNYINQLAINGSKVYVCGASTRGTVLLQYLYLLAGWGQENCPSPLWGVADRDEHKHGLKMMGSWLDIMPEDLVRSKATHMLVLPWHFKESITKREQEWIAGGGELIFPLPEVSVAHKYALDEMMVRNATI